MRTDRSRPHPFQAVASRRRFLVRAAALAVAAPAAASILAACGNDDDDENDRPLTADEALDRLIEGNIRYAEGNQRYPDQSEERREEVAGGQQPFATILGCIDSRVPHELVFDQGLGSVFSVRVAGNVLDASVLGSIEFGLVELDVPLVVVLGHERCGAVTAAVEALESGQSAPGDIQSIVDALAPAIHSVEDDAGDIVENAVRANARLVAHRLRQPGTLIGDAAANGDVRVVAMRYDLDTGLVELLA